jgi:hypothetical protein
MTRWSDEPMKDEPIFIAGRDRERDFFVGAALALIPAVSFLPTVTYLIVFPRVAQGRLMGCAIVCFCALLGGIGLWKLALGAADRPWGIFNILNIAALLVLLVIAAYTGVFLALLTLRL